MLGVILFLFVLGYFELAESFVVVGGGESCAVFFEAGGFVLFNEWGEEVEGLLPFLLFH